MHTFWQDLRYAARTLLRQRGFTAIAGITLALGIGANTAIFSVISGLILTPPAVAEADRVVALWRTTKGAARIEGYVSYLELQDWRARARSFEAIAAYKPNGFILLGEERAERIQGLRVTSNFLELLRVQPARGRSFREEEETRGHGGVVLVSHRFWQNRLGGSDSAVGSALTLNGAPFTIIGVLPADFVFPLAPEPIELVTTIAEEGGNLDERGAQVIRGLGRLRPGVTLSQAQTELARIAEELAAEFPRYSEDVTLYARPIDEQIVGLDVRRALWVLFGAVGFLLLMACANVTNLLLARTGARHRELAMRVALGAGTWRIARHLLAETLLLALLALVAGLFVSVWTLAAIKHFGAAQLPRIEQVEIDTLTLAFTLGLSVLTAAILSLLPVLRAARTNISDALKTGTKNLTGGSTRWWHDSLIVAEVALGLVLLIGAGLMVRSFGLLMNVNPGFDPTGVLMGRISMTHERYDSHDERVRYIHDTLERLRALPGVQSAAFVAPMPFSGGNVGSDFEIEGRAGAEPNQDLLANNRSATAEYFETLGIRLVRGRHFSEQDRRNGSGVAIVNETFARKYFPNEDALGARISGIGANQNEGDPTTWEIVGVIGDVRHNSLVAPVAPELYLPYSQNSWTWGHFLVRRTGDAGPSARVFAETIVAADRTIPVTGVTLLTEAIAETLARARFYTLMFALFGVTGLILTLTGVYGVVSYTVSQRTREIGIRMAFGAHAGDVLKLVIGRGTILASVGATLGLLGAWALSRMLESLLYGVTPTDRIVFATTAASLVLLTAIASFVPAQRAARVDPMVALRQD